MPSLESPSPFNASVPVAEIQVSARLLADGHVAEALGRLEALSSAVPAYATSQVLLAKAYEADQRWEEALEAWHRAHFLAPGSPLVQRGRRRLLDAKKQAMDVASPPPIPPQLSAESAAAQMHAEDTGASTENGPEHTAEVVEPTEESLESVQDEAMHHVTDPSEPEERVKAPLEEGLPEVFINDSVPVSDALGAAAVAEIWEDEKLDSVDDVPLVDEPIIAAPEFDATADEHIAGAPDGDSAWWKRSPGIGDESDIEDIDTGWTVLSEMETSASEPGVSEAQITAPIDEAVQEARSEAEDIEDRRVVGADATPPDDLDSLIRKLEDAPRIRPDPNFVGEEEKVFDDDIADDMVSETLARIYVAQGQYAEAASVYEKLADQQPEQAEEFSEKAAELRARVDDGSEASDPQNVG